MDTALQLHTVLFVCTSLEQLEHTFYFLAILTFSKNDSILIRERGTQNDVRRTTSEV